jgi:hypothetical protein
MWAPQWTAAAGLPDERSTARYDKRYGAALVRFSRFALANRTVAMNHRVRRTRLSASRRRKIGFLRTGIKSYRTFVRKAAILPL